MGYARSGTSDQPGMMTGDKDWYNKFTQKDEDKTLVSMNKAMDSKIAESLKRNELSMIKSKKRTSYVSINQDVHLGGADTRVDLQKLAVWDRIQRLASNFPWVSLRKMTVMWKTGVSNNVRWNVKMSFTDRRDNNDATGELFMMDFPVSDNFIMMMSPGYTAYMKNYKGLLPWRFEFDFPDGEFRDGTVFGTLKIKLEVDQYREATQVDEITPIVRFTRVTPAVEEPTLRWMSKGRWYQASATQPEPHQLSTIASQLDDMRQKYDKFLAFLGFDPVKLAKHACYARVHEWVEPQDIEQFENNPMAVAKQFSLYQAKYREKVRREMASSVFVPQSTR